MAGSQSTTVSLHHQTAGRIKALMESDGARFKTNDAVVRKALRLLELMVEAERHQKTLAIVPNSDRIENSQIQRLLFAD